MTKLVFFTVVLFVLVIAIPVGATLLLIWWRSLRRKWRLEAEEDAKRARREALEEMKETFGLESEQRGVDKLHATTVDADESEQRLS